MDAMEQKIMNVVVNSFSHLGNLLVNALIIFPQPEFTRKYHNVG